MRRLDHFPLTPLQAGMLAQQLRAPDSGVDVEQIVCSLPEAVDAETMQVAWAEVASRHEVLRASFRWEDVSAAQHVFAERIEFPLEQYDWSETPAELRQQRLTDFLAADRRRGIDLATSPLWRVTLIRWGATDFQMIWTFHHAILDGRSFTIVLQELFARYDGDEKLPDAPVPFRRHMEWLAANDWTASEEFWSARLAGFTQATPLPGGPQRGDSSGTRQGDEAIELSTSATAALVEMATRSDLTLNTLIQGAWAILLANHAEEQDVVFGVVRAGRRSSVAGADGMVGLLINTLPMRVAVDPAAKLGNWLGTVRAEWNAMRPVEHTPLSIAQHASGVSGGQPLFETAVMFERYQLAEVLRAAGGRAATRDFRLHEQNGFALTLTAYAGERLLLRLEYDAARYDSATALELLDQLRTLLEQFPSHVSRPVGELGLLSAAGRARVIDEFNATAHKYPGGETLLDMLESQASATPELVAVEDELQSLTYAQLHQRAAAVATWLTAQGVGPGDLVGVALERSVELVVALVSVLKAGAAYVPIDPDYPDERRAFMLEDSGVRVLIDASTNLDPDTRSGDAPPARASALDPAYMIYTSGSTGRPKGALNSHRGIVNRLRWMQDEYRIGDGDAVLQKTPISFDVSVWEFFWPLVTGARLVLARPGGHRDPEYLAEVIERAGITVTHFVPSMLQAFLADPASGMGKTTLRHVVCSGEALGVDLAERFFAKFPTVQLHNLYGPTEAAVDVSYWRCIRGERRPAIPIGSPVANTQLYVLDAALAPVPIGVPGELYIAGVQVGMGYHGRPELTAEKFVADPFSPAPDARMYRTGDRARWRADGALDYLGRVDFQVKLHGQRLELGEIEAALTTCPGVDAAAALIWKDDQGERLVAYYVSSENNDPGAVELRATLSRILPPGVVPATFMRVALLPLTPNGKLDRKALPAPTGSDRVATSFVAPATPIEQELARIWQEALRSGPVGATDNFFELGGDSILMIQIVARARTAGIRISLSTFFERPTVAALAHSASTAAAVSPGGAAMRQLTSAALTPVQRWFFETQPQAPDHWNQAFLFDVPTEFNGAAFQEALTAVVARHDALQLRFIAGQDGWHQQRSASADTVTLGHINLSRTAAADEPAAITAACNRVQDTLNIGRGPLLQAEQLDLADGRKRLLLIVHHLVIDGISWRVLIEDLERAYRQVIAGTPIVLLAEETSFLNWAHQLEHAARSEALKAEQGYWREVVSPASRQLPVDSTGSGPSIEADTAVIAVALDAAETSDLLQRVPAAYKTQINDVLLAALAMALQEWVGRGSILVDVEGHGREDVVPGADLSRTVGWFTSIFPVRLVVASEDAGNTLRAVKSQLRRVPGRGIGYGMLRYLAGDTTLAAAAPILFNYLGQLDALIAGSTLFKFAEESEGSWRAPSARRTHALQIDALVRGGRFEVRWSYDSRAHTTTTINRVAESFVESLRRLIDHCVNSTGIGYTPADFPLARLDQPTLDAVVGSHRTVEDIYPATPMQRLFLGYAAAGGNDPGFEQWQYRLTGDVDIGALRAAWQQTVDRHPVLRTAFHVTGVAQPLQVVLPNVDLPWTSLDWRTVEPAEQQRKLDALLAADGALGFTPDHAPLMRITVVQLQDCEYRLVWSHHHLLLDRWSWALVLQDVKSRYVAHTGQTDPDQDPVVPYAAYVRWLAAQDDVAAEKFWRSELAGFVRPLPFRRLTELAAPNLNRAPAHIQLTTAETAALREFAAGARVGVNTVIQGAWALWLAYHFDTLDVVYGVSVAGRPEDLAGADRMIGMTINNIPVRVRLDVLGRLASWLAALQARQGEVQRFGHVAPDQIQGWTELPPRSRLFESLVVFQDATTDRETAAWLGQNVSVERFPISTHTGYPISLIATGEADVTLAADFDAAYFLQETAQQALETVRTLLQAMISNPDARVKELLERLQASGRGAGTREADQTTNHEPYLAPRSSAEAVMAERWAGLLGVERVGVNDNFFALGGHSLLALQVVSRVRDTFRMEVPVRTVFANPTVAEFTRAVTALERRPGQMERVAQLVQQVASMSDKQVSEQAHENA